MTRKPKPKLPSGGGSFLRDKDGALVKQPHEDAKAQAAPEVPAEKPAKKKEA